MGDVINQSGYVIMSCGIVEPSKNNSEWFKDMVSDVTSLHGTNNSVNIFNGTKSVNDFKREQILFSKWVTLTPTLSLMSSCPHSLRFDITKRYPGQTPKPPSDPEILGRLEKFVRPWFLQMEHQLTRLGLLHPPRTRAEFKLLVAHKGCAAQKLHWDFNPDVVQSLIVKKQFEGVPVSCLCSFTPAGSYLIMKVNLTP